MLGTWTQPEVANASLDLLFGRIIQVRVEDLLGQGQRPIQTAANNLKVLHQFLVRHSRVLKVESTFYFILHRNMFGSNKLQG
jgi:hypothetical protein